MSVKVNHPKFTHVVEQGKSLIAVFAFGGYAPIPKEAQAAWKRAMAALEGITQEDIALIREWGGNVRATIMNTQLVNPEITDDDVASCVAATLEAYSGWRLDSKWLNSSNGVYGVSVKIFGGKKS